MSNPDQSPALSLEEFRHWLNNRRMMDVSMAFGDIVERYREATEAAAMAATVPAVAKFMGRRLTPEGTSEFWGVLLCDPKDNPAEGTLLHMAAQAPVAGQPAEPSPADMLDWLDETNKRFKMGWEVGAAPAGNVSVRTIIMGGKPIREAIRAAMPAPKGDSNG